VSWPGKHCSSASAVVQVAFTKHPLQMSTGKLNAADRWLNPPKVVPPARISSTTWVRPANAGPYAAGMPTAAATYSLKLPAATLDWRNAVVVTVYGLGPGSAGRDPSGRTMVISRLSTCRLFCSAWNSSALLTR